MMIVQHGDRVGLKEHLLSYDVSGYVNINVEKRLIYMRTPRTGSTSIMKNLNAQGIKFIRSKKSIELFNSTINELKEEELVKYTIFAIVRNPWERAVSQAAYFGINIYKYLDTLITPSTEPDGWQRKFFTTSNFDKHAAPQHLNTHMNGEYFVDFICRNETLDNDLKELCELIKIEYKPLRMINTSDHEPYTEYYNKQRIEKVGLKYKKDIALFDYTFNEKIGSVMG